MIGLQGKIGFHSEGRGAGATFYFEIPLFPNGFVAGVSSKNAKYEVSASTGAAYRTLRHSWDKISISKLLYPARYSKVCVHTVSEYPPLSAESSSLKHAGVLHGMDAAIAGGGGG